MWRCEGETLSVEIDSTEFVCFLLSTKKDLVDREIFLQTDIFGHGERAPSGAPGVPKNDMFFLCAQDNSKIRHNIFLKE